jgi:hypothetical protein
LAKKKVQLTKEMEVSTGTDESEERAEDDEDATTDE